MTGVGIKRCETRDHKVIGLTGKTGTKIACFVEVHIKKQSKVYIRPTAGPLPHLNYEVVWATGTQPCRPSRLGMR